MERVERVGPYNLVKTLGVGASGKVKLGIHQQTGERVAIKILTKDKLVRDPKLLRRVEREIAVMRLIRHPHILRLFDVFQSETHLFLILEYVEGGELYTYVQQRGRLELGEAFRFFSQILNGLSYCHDNLICHRDLKLENILLDKDNNVKIADFGMASLMREEEMLRTSCGSPHYASPEVVRGDMYDGFQADVWSLGVILYALTTGRLPFDADSLPRLLCKVKRGRYVMPAELPANLQQLLSRMLEFDPRRRIKLRRIPREPWYVEWNSVLQTDDKWHERLPASSTVTGIMYRFSNLSTLSASTNEPEVDDADEAAASGMVGGESTDDLCAEALDDDEPQRTMVGPIIDIDQEAMLTIQSLLGGASPEELEASLRSEDLNIEKIIYNLLIKRRDSAEPDVGVSMGDAVGSAPTVETVRQPAASE